MPAELTAANYRTLALAALVQAAQLVHCAANGRPFDAVAREAVLAAVATHRAGSLAEVFPDPSAFSMGLRELKGALGGEQVTPEVARYCLQLVDLAARLRRNRDTMATLASLLDAVQDPSPYALADVYQQTIATLGKRIQVTGDGERLRRDEVAAEVRALLLGGVRVAWLWHQLGGRRWHVLVSRSNVLAEIGQLAKALTN